MRRGYKHKCTALLSGLVLFYLLLSGNTVAQVLGSPVLLSPANGATNQSTSITLQWNSVSAASSYSVEVATDTAFNNLVVNQSGLSGTSYQVTGLLNGTTYYWRAGASTLILFGGWSSPWSFTTSAVSPPTTLSAPTLVSPANNAANQSTGITFKWESVQNATNYHFQLSTSSSFGSVTADNPNITDTSQHIILLSNNQLYYWRVSAGNSNTNSPWSSVWSFTTTMPQLPAPSLVSPPNDTTTLPTNITFAWNAVQNADHYHIQIATTPLFDTLIVDDSSLTIPAKQIDSLSPNQIYFWRVSAKDSTTNGQWSSTRVVKTSSKPASTLAAPSLVSPTNGATNQSTTLTLQWSSVSGATSYSVEVATDAAFTNIIVNQSGLANTSYQASGLAKGTTYYWRAGATNVILFSGWSNVWSFTTIPNVIVLSAPVLNSPSNGAVSQPITLSLAWNAVSGASSYNLEVAKDSLFSALAVSKNNLTSISEQISGLLKNTIYYWRVSAFNSQDTSVFSTTWNFKTYADTIPLPTVPILLTPADSSANEPLYPILSWSKSTNAQFYRLQVATDQLFNNLIFDDSIISQTYYQVGQLGYNIKYFWRVNAKDSAGSSNWSTVWYFTTQNNSSNVPVLVSPTDGSNNQPLSVACMWDTISNASVYNLQLSTSPDFSSIVFNDSTGVNTSEVVGNLNSSTSYFWRVRAKVSSGWGEFTSTWRFTTMSAAPTYISLDTVIQFPSYSSLSDFKSTDYRLIGMPGAGNVPLNTFLTGPLGKGWEAYWDNGAPNNYFVGYGAGNDFVFAPGESYWIIKNGSLKIDTTVENIPLNSNGNVNITLHSGWNLITDPFNYAVDWSQVKAKNSISENIYSFNGAFQISQALTPFSGYYYFNGTGAAALEISPQDTLLPPLTKVNSANANSSELDWEVNIKLQAEEYTDSAAWFGTSFNASKGFNTFDLHKPRNMGSIPEIFFLHPDWNKDYSVFASDIRPPFDSYEEWPFEISSSPQHTATITFSGLDQIPEQFDVYLHNILTDKWTNLRKDNSYQFVPSESTTSFKVVVGTKEAIKDKIGNINTSGVNGYQLGNNYPNPFNLSTMIPVTINKQSNVEIKVFNIIGKEVKTIYHGILDSGEHFFRWDGTDNNGRVVSSGIYFYRLIVPQYPSLIKKMVLLK